MVSIQEMKVQTKDPHQEVTLATGDCEQEGTEKVVRNCSNSNYAVSQHLDSDSAKDHTMYNDTTFIPMPVFEGSRQGYVFKLGNHGLGYYLDSCDRRPYYPGEDLFTTEDTSSQRRSSDAIYRDVKQENQKRIYSLEEIIKFNNNIQMRDELIISLEHSEKKNQRLTKFINYVADLLNSTPNDIKTLEKTILQLHQENLSLKETRNSPPHPTEWGMATATIKQLREENRQLKFNRQCLEDRISKCEPSLRDYLRGRNWQAPEDEENDCEDAPKTIEQLLEENGRLRENIRSVEKRISGCEPSVSDFIRD